MIWDTNDFSILELGRFISGIADGKTLGAGWNARFWMKSHALTITLQTILGSKITCCYYTNGSVRSLVRVGKYVLNTHG